MSRIRSDFWVSAEIRRCGVEGIDAVLRRRGSPEAGAIFVSVDRLDGNASLFAPAPQSLIPDESYGRLFVPVASVKTPLDVEERMRREISFDPDLWWLSIDDREGRQHLDLAAPDRPPSL